MSLKTYLENAEEVDFFEDLSDSKKEVIDLMAACAIFIHEKRLQLGMNQKEFGELFGASQGMVSKWESGDCNFTIQKLEEIIRVLKNVVDQENKSKEPKVGYFVTTADTRSPESDKVRTYSTGSRRSSAPLLARV